MHVDNAYRETIPWHGNGVRPDTYPEHKAYLERLASKFVKDVTRLIVQGLEANELVLPTRFCIPYNYELLHITRMWENIYHKTVERSELETSVQQFLLNPVLSQRPLVLHGNVGSGKTSLLTRVFANIPEWFQHKTRSNYKAITRVMRFCTTSVDSSYIHQMLASISRQICKAYKIKFTDKHLEMLPLYDIGVYFKGLLKEVAEINARQQRQLFILLDDCMDYDHPEVDNLAWLPLECPFNVYVIVAVDGSVLENLRTLIKDKQCFVEIDKLDKDDCTKMYLNKTGKPELEAPQENLVKRLKTTTNINPLSSHLLMEDCMTWTDENKPDDKKFKELADFPIPVIERWFGALEKRHGKMLTQFTLLYMSQAPDSLTEVELLDALSLNDEVLGEVYSHHDPLVDGVVRMPMLPLLRLFHDLKPWLMEFQSSDKTLLWWSNSIFSEVSTDLTKLELKTYRDLVQFLTVEAPVKRDIRLSKRDLMIPEADRLISVPNPKVTCVRRLVSLPYCMCQLHNPDVLNPKPRKETIEKDEENKSKPAGEDQAKPADEVKAKPAGEDKAKPIDEDEAKPAGEEAKPIDEDEAKPAGEDQSKPAAEDQAKTASEDQRKPAGEDIDNERDEIVEVLKTDLLMDAHSEPDGSGVSNNDEGNRITESGGLTHAHEVGAETGDEEKESVNKLDAEPDTDKETEVKQSKLNERNKGDECTPDGSERVGSSSEEPIPDNDTGKSENEKSDTKVNEDFISGSDSKNPSKEGQETPIIPEVEPVEMKRLMFCNLEFLIQKMECLGYFTVHCDIEYAVLLSKDNELDLVNQMFQPARRQLQKAKSVQLAVEILNRHPLQLYRFPHISQLVRDARKMVNAYEEPLLSAVYPVLCPSMLELYSVPNVQALYSLSNDLNSALVVMTGGQVTMVKTKNGEILNSLSEKCFNPEQCEMSRDGKQVIAFDGHAFHHWNVESTTKQQQNMFRFRKNIMRNMAKDTSDPKKNDAPKDDETGTPQAESNQPKEGKDNNSKSEDKPEKKSKANIQPVIPFKRTFSCFTLNKDGSEIVVGSHEGTLLLVEPSTGFIKTDHSGRPNEMDEALNKSPEATIRKYRAEGRDIPGHLKPVRKVAYTFDYKLVVSINSDIVIVWDAESMVIQREIHGVGGLSEIIMSPTGAVLAGVDGLYQVKVLDLTTGNIMHTFRTSGVLKDGTVGMLCFSNNGQYLAAGMGKHKVSVYKLANSTTVEILTFPVSTWHHVTFLCFDNTDQFLIGDCYQGLIKIWHLPSGSLYHSIQLTKGDLTWGRLDQNDIFYGVGDGQLKVVNLSPILMSARQQYAKCHSDIKATEYELQQVQNWQDQIYSCFPPLDPPTLPKPKMDFNETFLREKISSIENLGYLPPALQYQSPNDTTAVVKYASSDMDVKFMELVHENYVVMSARGHPVHVYDIEDGSLARELPISSCFELKMTGNGKQLIGLSDCEEWKFGLKVCALQLVLSILTDITVCCV